ncbi:acyltransferase [Kosakonia sacchari]|uniref:acyltransferase family protein n=1 Tax=Kosakonia sacchari TaxID=1158459 RepID=UPI0025AF5DFD|nr:acyltransferase [Kosakonia sacchari]MDN2486439.1 acyltransferase [Kosakonia sacchari]
MSHYNNLNILRLIFALFVIISHSYPISGTPGADWLAVATCGQVIFSSIGVDGFFIISGFLIFNSFKYRKSYADYIWKRCLRIFPALAVVLSLTVLIGFFFSTSTFYEYFWLTGSVKTYVLNNLSLYNLQPTISDVFATNPLPGTINGSLWTLVYEFSLYFLLMFCAFGKFLPKKIGQLLTVAIVISCAYLSIVYREKLSVLEFFWGLNLYYVLYFSSLYFYGSLLAAIKFNESKRLPLYCIASGIALILAIKFNCYTPVAHLLLPVFIISLGYAWVPKISVAYHRVGDLSYGVYIYGFPAQQTLMHLGNFSATSLMILSCIASLACGYLSWTIIEGRAMRYKAVFADYKPAS